MLIVALIVAGLGFVGVGYGAVAPIGVITESLGTTTTALRNLGGHLTTVVDLVDAAALEAKVLANRTSRLVDELERANETHSGAFASDLRRARLVEGLVKRSSSSLNSSTAIVDRVARPLSSFDNVLDHPSIRQYVQYVPLSATVAFASAILLLFITLLPIWLCKCPHRLLTSLGIFFMFILFVASAAVLALGVVLSDACAQSTLTAQTAAAVYETVDPPVLAPSVQFYTECNPAFLNDPAGVNMTNTPVQRVRDAKAALDAADPAVTAILDDITSGRYNSVPKVRNAADAVVTSFGSLFRATLAIQGDLECGGVQPLYHAVVRNVCFHFLESGTVTLWVMQTAAAGILVIVLLLNLTPLVLHPSDKTPGELDSPSGAVAPQDATAMYGGAYAGKPDGGDNGDDDPEGLSQHYQQGYHGGYGQ